MAKYCQKVSIIPLTIENPQYQENNQLFYIKKACRKYPSYLIFKKPMFLEFHISRCFETFVELSVLSKQWYGETTVLPRARGRSFPKRTYSADWVLTVFRNQRCKRVLTICPSLRMSPSHCVCILHLLGSKQLHLNLSLVILMSFLNHGRKTCSFQQIWSKTMMSI